MQARDVKPQNKKEKENQKKHFSPPYNVGLKFFSHIFSAEIWILPHSWLDSENSPQTSKHN